MERAVQEVAGVIRTLRSALEGRLKSKVHLDHPLALWLVRHAGQLITRYQIRDTGKTSYRMIKGYDSVIPVAEFGELVHFKPLKTKDVPGKFEDRWVEGVYLGSELKSCENIVSVGVMFTMAATASASRRTAGGAGRPSMR